ncbi:MAG: GLUG motif-containing protein [Aestuariibaculum sp.]
MNKNYIFIVLFLALTWGRVFAQTYSGGSGTEADPFQIANKTDLQYLSENSSEWSYYFVQTADIIFDVADFQDGGSFYNEGEGFIPIAGGNNGELFTGSYNGNNYTIDGLVINRENSAGVGLFGSVNNSSSIGFAIGNLGLTNTNIQGQGNVGGLIGRLENGNIDNCFVTGTVVGNGNIVGGLIGFAPMMTSVVNNCYTAATVTSGMAWVGGLIGNSMATITNCYATGEVTSLENGYAGGLVGDSAGPISNCYATGNVSGPIYTGGLVGNTFSTISNCYATGSVTKTGTYDEEYANIGALIGGTHPSNPALENNIWNTETSGQTKGVGNNASAEGVIGKTTTEMQTQSTFTNAGWDFANTWDIACNYPTLKWEDKGIDVSTSVDGATITANASGVNITYQWLDSSNAAISGATSQSFTATANGNYKVIITQDGCSQTSEAVAITTLTINNDTQQLAVVLYPNPTRGNVTLSLPKAENTNITIYNVLGKMVYQTTITNKNVELPIQGQSGVYFVKVTTATSSKTLRVIKQ